MATSGREASGARIGGCLEARDAAYRHLDAVRINLGELVEF